MEDKYMVITFCGHTQFMPTTDCFNRITTFLTERVGDKPADIYLGGYGAFDLFAYDCCKKYKERNPNLLLYYITPYMPQKSKEDDFDMRRGKYDGVIYPELENKPKKFAISYRNQWMVDRADCVIAYVMHTWGGAYATYQYAKKKGKEVFNLAAGL